MVTKDKVKKNGNGKKADAELNNTVIEVKAPEPNQTAIAKKKNVIPNGFNSAWASQEGGNSLNLLAKAGEDPLDLLMRSKIADYRTLVSYAILWRKCIECEYQDGINEIRNMLAMAPSVGGLSREQVVKAIVGGWEGQQPSGQGDELSHKLRKAAFGR